MDSIFINEKVGVDMGFNPHNQKCTAARLNPVDIDIVVRTNAGMDDSANMDACCSRQRVIGLIHVAAVERRVRSLTVCMGKEHHTGTQHERDYAQQPKQIACHSTPPIKIWFQSLWLMWEKLWGLLRLNGALTGV
jgi:hypothetical protein